MGRRSVQAIRYAERDRHYEGDGRVRLIRSNKTGTQQLLSA